MYLNCKKKIMLRRFEKFKNFSEFLNLALICRNFRSLNTLDFFMINLC